MLKAIVCSDGDSENIINLIKIISRKKSVYQILTDSLKTNASV